MKCIIRLTNDEFRSFNHVRSLIFEPTGLVVTWKFNGQFFSEGIPLNRLVGYETSNKGMFD